jgi:predicted RecA/RadA family phage recombinase
MTIANKGIISKVGLDEITLVNGSGADLAVHEPMQYVGKIVLARIAVANGASAPFDWRGQFTMPKSTSEAFVKGQVVFWDFTNKHLDSDPRNPLAGRVVEAVGASTAECVIDLGDGDFEAKMITAVKNDSGGNLAIGGVLPTKGGETYSRIYIASEAVANSATGNFYKDLVVTLAKNPAIAFTRGIIVNWDSKNSYLTTATITNGHSIAGRVMVAAGTGVATAKIDISDRG